MFHISGYLWGSHCQDGSPPGCVSTRGFWFHRLGPSQYIVRPHVKSRNNENMSRQIWPTQNAWHLEVPQFGTAELVFWTPLKLFGFMVEISKQSRRKRWKSKIWLKIVMIHCSFFLGGLLNSGAPHWGWLFHCESLCGWWWLDRLPPRHLAEVLKPCRGNQDFDLPQLQYITFNPCWGRVNM